MSYALIWIILVILSTMRFQVKTQFSTFERNRLLKKGDSVAVMEVRELEENAYMAVIRELLISIALVVFVSLVIMQKPGVVGFLIAFIGVVAVPVAASLKPLRAVGDLVEKYLRTVLEPAVELAKPFLAPWKQSTNETVMRLNSKDELLALIEGSHGVMTRAELNRLKASLRFDKLKVTDILTPRKDVVAISQDETLGPLVLDEMYKTGHSRFPVYAQDIDHVVGVLYLQDIVDITVGQKTVAQAMRRPVMLVKGSQSLSTVLNSFIRKHQHLAVVMNDHKETVGVVSLEDVFAELIGEQALVGEFDN